MKPFMKLANMFLMAAILTMACEDENGETTPVISDVVAENHDTGSSEIPRGATISINFTAEARGDARLDYYHIEIHDHPASGKVEDEYRIIDDSFKDDDKFKGLKLVSVHKHVAVPDTANLGPYHVVIIVADDQGYTTDTEELDIEIEIVE